MLSRSSPNKEVTRMDSYMRTQLLNALTPKASDNTRSYEVYMK